MHVCIFAIKLCLFYQDCGEARAHTILDGWSQSQKLLNGRVSQREICVPVLQIYFVGQVSCTNNTMVGFAFEAKGIDVWSWALSSSTTAKKLD